MSEVRLAMVAQHLFAYHAMLSVGAGGEAVWLVRLPETGPAAAGFKLYFRIKQRVVAAHAAVDAAIMAIPVFAGEWRFCTALAAYVKLFGREFFAPCFDRFFNWGCHKTSPA